MEPFSPLFKHANPLKQRNFGFTKEIKLHTTSNSIFKIRNSRCVRCRKFKLYMAYKSVGKIVYDLTVQITDAFSFRYVSPFSS